MTITGTDTAATGVDEALEGDLEISIWLVVYVERKRNAYLREQGVSDDDLFSDDGQPGHKS